MKVAVLEGRALARARGLAALGRAGRGRAAPLGHEVVAIDAGGELVARLKAERPDVAFIALHGPGGEDGTVQELLEILGIPYTGPGVAACVRCMDKVLAKHEIRAAGIPTPDWFAFNATAFRELGAADALEEIEGRLGFPLVVKPARQGSSLGVKFAAGARRRPRRAGRRVQLRRPGAARALRRGPRAGGSDARRRAAAGRRGDPASRRTATTSRPATRSAAPTYVCPAELREREAPAVSEAARRTYEALGCAGFARVDLMLGRRRRAPGARGQRDPRPHRHHRCFPRPRRRRGCRSSSSSAGSSSSALARARASRPRCPADAVRLSAPAIVG